MCKIYSISSNCFYLGTVFQHVNFDLLITQNVTILMQLVIFFNFYIQLSQIGNYLLVSGTPVNLMHKQFGIHLRPGGIALKSFLILSKIAKNQSIELSCYRFIFALFVAVAVDYLVASVVEIPNLWLLTNINYKPKSKVLMKD